jgi:hypothetical protein
MDGAALKDAAQNRLGKTSDSFTGGSGSGPAEHEAEEEQEPESRSQPSLAWRSHAACESRLRDAAYLLTESLKHPKHSKTLAPAKLKLTKLFRLRFRKQQSAFLRESRKWLTWLSTRYSEASGDAKPGITHTVQTNISAGSALNQPASKSDSDAYDSLVGDVADGAASVLSVDLAIATAAEQANIFTEGWLRENGFQKLAADVDRTTRDQIASGVADVYAKGGSYDDAVQSIKDTFTTAADYRAEMIATTELNDAYNSALLDSAKQADGLLKTWEPDGECCDLCQQNVDAGPIEVDEDFPSGDDAPPAHPNCFLAGTLVSAAGITCATRRKYEGKIVIIRCAGVDDVAVTPNHPILTLRGWLPARAVQIGDRLAQCASPAQAVVILDPDDHYIETSIEQIAYSLLMAGGVATSGMPHSPEAFHGDVSAQREVDIVRTARPLSRYRVDGIEHGKHSAFGLRHSRRVAFLEERSFLEMLECLLLPAHRTMSGLGLALTRFRRHCAGAVESGAAPVALLEAEALPLPKDCTSADSDPVGNLQETLALLMRPVEVNGIEITRFNGHVYNLETRDGIYFANSIIAHNCDCSLGFVKDEDVE